jgi:Protein of unknown function (DUF1173)
MNAYEIDNRAYADDDAELPAALKRAHGGGSRPLCLCRPFSAKLPMVIERRTGDGQSVHRQDTTGHDLYILRRMPGRGHEHSPACKHYEPPEGLSGRNEHLGGAIRTDDDGAHHILRLAFPLSHKEKAAASDEAMTLGEPSKSRKRFARLTLLGFLHHVLESAELNKMHKGLHGKRSWNVMRGRILETMRAQATSRYRDLAAFTFVPRIFSIEQKDELFRDWRAIERKAGAEKRSILLFAELKDIDAGQITFKHLPQRCFALKPDVQKPFLDALERITGLMSGPRGAGHVIACAVVTVGEGDALSVADIAMTAATAHWIPFGSMAEYRLLVACDDNGRGYFKCLDYGQDNYGKTNAIAALLLTDTGDSGTAVFLIDEQPTDAQALAMKAIEDKGIPVWRCDIAEGRPALPLRRSRTGPTEAGVPGGTAQ